MGFLRLYLRVVGLLAPERRLVWVLCVANVALAAFGFAEPVLFGHVVDLLADPAGADRDAIWRVLAIWGAIGVAGVIANIWVALHADRLAHRRRVAAIEGFFAHVISLPRAFHGATHTGRLLKVQLQGADQLFGLWLSVFREHLATFVAILVLLPLTLLLNWRLALLLILLMVVFAAMVALVIGRTERAQGGVEAFHTALAQRSTDVLGNVALVQSFARVAAEMDALRAIGRQVLAAQYPVLNWWAMAAVLTRMAATVTVILIFVLGVALHSRGQASIGDIVSFMGFATLLVGRLDQAMGFAMRVFFQMPALREYFEVLDTRASVGDLPGATAIGPVRGEVAFERVSYSYDGRRPALHDIDFRVPAGATVALVGPTGAGKSTLMALLQRQQDPTAGVVRIDGRDLRTATLDSLRRVIGVVFQDNALFNRSIAENLRIGDPDASDERLAAAAARAEADGFVRALPDGYATMVGERGQNLSGGERQRLAIARALLKDPPILILDEATSALDGVTEARVQQALAEVARGRTTFVIAHRLATVRGADLILVLDGGRLVEMGAFDALVAAGGLFHRMVATQSLGGSDGHATPSDRHGDRDHREPDRKADPNAERAEVGREGER
jgi:ATP-binding cassette subfamily B protein